MPILKLDHAQLAMPAGREAEAQAFSSGLLGIPERLKPANLAGRGGCWFESGDVRVHLGVDAAFAPARKAHPAFRVRGLSELVAGVERRFVDGPFGNRIESMEAVG